MIRSFVSVAFVIALAVPAQAANPFSDDFNECTMSDLLANGWTLTDPHGTASVQSVGAGTGEAFLRFSMPSGTPKYDAWSGFPTAVSYTHLTLPTIHRV